MSGFAPDHFGAEVRVSPNFGPRQGVSRPDMIVLHYTGMVTGQAAEARLCDPASEVSSHYLVHENGRIVQMARPT
jgi:N-acetylmuramoyl-L-alanine amidase